MKEGIPVKILRFITAQSELYDRKAGPVAERYGLTAAELSILLFLSNNPEHDTATEIVKIRRLAKSHVSTSIRSLELRGFVKREYRNGDRRTAHLVLLPSSREIVRAGNEAQTDFLSVLTGNFSPDELRALEGFIDRMSGNVFRALKEPAGHGE